MTPEDMKRSYKRAAAKRIAVHMIEGESVTATQIAERVGCRADQVPHRLQMARKQPGPVTWAKLQR